MARLGPLPARKGAYAIGELPWNTGTMGHVELAAEAGLAEASWLFGLLGTILGDSGGVGVGSAVGFALAGFALILGIAALVYTAKDLVNIGNEWSSE